MAVLAALYEAIELRRRFRLSVAYQAADAEWEDSADAVLWENTSGDGLGEETH